MSGRTRIQFRRDNAAQWTSNNPTLASGELGYEEDTGKFKIGNGTTAWNDLEYAVNNAGSPGDPGSLAAHQIDTTNVHGIANTSNLVLTNDSRLSDARTPTAHKSTHATGGTDALSASDIGAATSSHNHSGAYDPLGTASSLISVHASATTSIHGISDTSKLIVDNDSRLSDARTPTAHKSSHATGGTDALSASDIGAASSGHNHSGVYDAAGTAASLIAAHASATTNIHGITNTSNLILTTDSRLSDSRTPTAHKSTHATGGTDALSASDIGAAASNHNHSGTYDPLGTASSLITTHEAASDPHPTYLTATEGNAAYDALGSAASAVSTHASASDPHGDRSYTSTNFVPQTRTISSGDGLSGGGDLTTNRTLSVNFGTAAPSTSSVGATANVGTATTTSRSDHQHAREGFGTVIATTGFNATSTNGTATTVSRSDHSHGSPTLTAGTAITVSSGTVNVNLATATPIASSTSGSVGTSTNVAKEDHIHPTSATAANTSNAIVQRDSSGGFTAGTLTVAGVTASGTVSAAVVTSTGELTAYHLKVNVATTTSALDFSTEGYKTISSGTAVTFTASNYAAGRTITIRVTNSSSPAASINLTFPSTWVFVGTKPTAIAASKVGILTVTSFGTTEADCVAAWAVQS